MFPWWYGLSLVVCVIEHCDMDKPCAYWKQSNTGGSKGLGIRLLCYYELHSKFGNLVL